MPEITIDRPPLSANRAYEIHGRGRQKWIGKTSDYDVFESDIKTICQAKDIQTVNEPIRLEILFYLSRQHRSHDTMNGLPTRDIDNCLKPLFDVMEGVIWENDTQVCQLNLEKKHAENERMMIRWEIIDAGQ